MKKNAGYSLIELSIALAILSLVIVSGLIGVQRILANNAANNLLRTFPLIVANLTVAYANQPTTAGLTTATAIGMGLVPTHMIVNNTTINNAFNGIDTIQSNSRAVGTLRANNGFIYIMTQIPVSMCTTVVNGLDPLAAGIVVWNGVDAFDPTNVAGPSLVKMPGDRRVDMALLANACNASNDDMPRSIATFLDRS